MTSKPLSSMTGFARISGAAQGLSWSWEVRSVNGKSLDIRLRLPSEFSSLDGEQLQKAGGTDISALLAVAGVVEEISSEDISQNKDEAEARAASQKKLETALMESFRQLIAKLETARQDEGLALMPVLMRALSEIEAGLERAEKLSRALPEKLHTRLKEKLSVLLSEGLSEDKLAQEAAILVLKADVREELDRLSAHCKQARTLVAQGSPIGRKLDFLAQEFNREVNTLCSKSSDIDLTQIGLGLKSHIEQFREQAANVE